jgi:serine/threonine protein kinase
MRIGERALRGLSHAHGLGIVHHDIKPANVLITPSGEVKLCDFGLSALAALASRGELNEGVVAGTPQYISPEAINRLPVDGRSDLYSLAATLYDLVVGVPPFGRDPLTAYRGHLYQAPPNHPQLPAALGAILFKALAKKPEERFESAEAMRTELLAIMSVAKSKPGPASSKPEAPISAAPQPAARSGEEGQDEWIELEEEMVVERDASAPKAFSPTAASPPLPDEPMTKPPPLKSSQTSKGQVNQSMKSLEQLVSQESWLQAAARADGNGNVQELVGKADGESVSAAVAMCFQPLEKAAELLGFGNVTGFCLGSKKSVLYVRREGAGFTVGIGQAASNPEVSMKKFTKALAEK